MANYKRRFTKEEFRKELFTHLRDMPPQYLHKHENLEEIAKVKAEHYSRALDALDAAMDRVRKIASTHQDAEAQKDADLALKEINDAINAYGEASMSGNSSWDIFNSER